MKIFRSLRLFLLAMLISIVPASSFAGVFISIGIAPPVLPVYVQPPCPEEGLMWTPGYWAYGPDGYYWIPGAWVPAPYAGALWTPPYWGWEGGHYLFHDGYWGSHVGYYGGVNYGFGYMGIGFAGGEWRGGRFAYNTAVMNVNRSVIRNTYVNQTIVRNNTIVNDRRVAFSGGPGGIRHNPTPQERMASNERHVGATSVQQQHFQAAARDPQQRFSANRGRPATVAAARPLTSPGRGNSNSRPETNRPGTAARPENRPAQQSRPEARPAQARPTESRPTQQSRPATQARPESRPAQQSRPESRPAQQSRPAQSRPASRPAEHERPRGR